ncbi:MAG: hypothetical protein JJT90_00990 [Ectothiorhodospiraceae bacterium]|nr:hypothetical protein [Ectothiorhodospiraceae bacterium]
MARLDDLPPVLRENMLALSCPTFGSTALVPPRPLLQHTVALVSTAGLSVRGEPPFKPNAKDFRSIAKETGDEDLLITHVSVNFDRTGFQQDVEVMLPRQRLRELAEQDLIGNAADTHYSFMGATDPELMQPHAEELVRDFRDQGVTAAVLLPV